MAAHVAPTLLILFLTATAFAGCTTAPSQDKTPVPGNAQSEMPETHSLEPPPEEAAQTSTPPNDMENRERAIKLRHIEVYSSSGWVVGAAPAHPSEPGPLIAGKLVRQDTFLAPPGTTNFTVSIRDFIGAYSGGIEITDANGTVVFLWEGLLNQAGPTGFGSLDPQWKGRPVTSGLHTVSYYIAGVTHMTVAVEAHVQG